MRGEADFADAIHWLELARKYKVRLPFWHRPCTTGGMRSFLRKIGVSVDEYKARTNSSTLRDFPSMNPDWPLRAWAGIELEWLDAKDKEPVQSIPLDLERPKRGRPKKIIEVEVEREGQDMVSSREDIHA